MLRRFSKKTGVFVRNIVVGGSGTFTGVLVRVSGIAFGFYLVQSIFGSNVDWFMTNVPHFIGTVAITGMIMTATQIMVSPIAGRHINRAKHPEEWKILKFHQKLLQQLLGRVVPPVQVNFDRQSTDEAMVIGEFNGDFSPIAASTSYIVGYALPHFLETDILTRNSLQTFAILTGSIVLSIGFQHFVVYLHNADCRKNSHEYRPEEGYRSISAPFHAPRAVANYRAIPDQGYSPSNNESERRLEEDYRDFFPPIEDSQDSPREIDTGNITRRQIIFSQVVITDTRSEGSVSSNSEGDIEMQIEGEGEGSRRKLKRQTSY